jgi:hypothetical protein
MAVKVLIAHAKGEEHFAEFLAEPLRDAGYEVVHRGTVMVGESVVEEASKVLNSGAPVVMCGTIKAVGTKWARQVVNAARQNSNGKVFFVQMEEEADVNFIAFDEVVALYWQDSAKALRDLIASLQKYYSPNSDSAQESLNYDVEKRYRELALESCDIIDLANLPENDRHIATRQLELRRLYVALRVKVEIPVNVEAKEEDLKALEERRGRKNRRAFYLEKNEVNNDEDDRIPVGHRLAEARRLIVLGDPGAGKTTMIRWIATAYLLRLKQDSDWNDLPDVATLPNEDWLPVIIRCRDLDQSSLNGSLDDILRHTLRKSEMKEEECIAFQTLLKGKLSKGQALLLLDGLDEISDPAVRTRFCKQIEQITIAYPNAPIIATSRIVGYREMGYRIGRGFEHVTVTDLSKEDKDDFAKRWCTLTELPERQVKATEELIHDIHSTDRIERLTGSPMLLTTMALVKRKVGKLPNRRVDLYYAAVDVLLNWRREVDEPIDDHEAIPQLEYVAYAMCDRGVQQLREDVIIELFEQMRGEYPQIHAVQKHTPEEFLHLLERRTGILVEAGVVRHNGRPTPVYEFRHLTFQEYLAGLALVEGRFLGRDRSCSLAENVAPLAGRTTEVENDFEGKELVVTENWREALRLSVASCNDDDVDSVLKAILTPLEDENDGVTARPRAVLAVLCLVDEPNVSDIVAKAVILKFIEQIGENDGHAPFTSLDAAAIELTSSRWVDIFQDFLTEELFKRDTSTRDNVLGLCAMVFATFIPKNKRRIQDWILDHACLINNDKVAAASE